MKKQRGDTIVIATYRSRTEAEMIQSMLTSKNIRSFVLGDDAGGMYPPLMNGIKLYVSKKDEKRAHDIL